MVQKFFLKVSCMSKLICFHNHHHRIGIIRQVLERSQCSYEDYLFHVYNHLLFIIFTMSMFTKGEKTIIPTILGRGSGDERKILSFQITQFPSCRKTLVACDKSSSPQSKSLNSYSGVNRISFIGYIQIVMRFLAAL